MVLCAAGLGFSQNPSTPSGSVQGVVLDDSGKPLPDARVYALPEENMLKPITTNSDTAGNFILSNIPVGGVYINAFKESEGYPDDRFAFYKAEGRPIKVTVINGQPVTGVTLRLGPKAAYLHLEIRNQEGMPINAQAAFTREDIDRPGDLYRTSLSANDSMMVLPVAFRLRIEAEGYLPWHYGGSNWQGKDGIIQLRSGETMNLQIQLTPR